MLQRWALDLSAYDYTIEQNLANVFLMRIFWYSKFADPNGLIQNDRFSVNPLPFDWNMLIVETKFYYGQTLSGIRNGWSTSAKKRFPDIYRRREDLSGGIEGEIEIGSD